MRQPRGPEVREGGVEAQDSEQHPFGERASRVDSFHEFAAFALEHVESVVDELVA